MKVKYFIQNVIVLPLEAVKLLAKIIIPCMMFECLQSCKNNIVFDE